MTAGEEAAFLAPLSVRELWGVGPKTAEALAVLGIRTIGDLARHSDIDLVARFGKNGYEMARRAKGIDERPVETERETKSVSQETTFSRDLSDREVLRRKLLAQAEGIGKQLRSSGLRGNTIKLKLRWANFTTLTRQMTLPERTDQDLEIYEAALALFDKAWPIAKPVRLIGVGVSGFEPTQRQLSLWDIPPAASEPEDLKSALDQLREKFGDKIVRRGSDLKRRGSA